MSAWGLDKSRRIGFIINDGISAGTNYLDSITDGVLRYGGSALLDTSTAASTYAALSGGNTFSGNQTMNNDILFSTGTTHYLRQVNATSTNEMFSVGFAGKPISTYRYSSLGKYGWYIDATEKAFVFENTAVDFDELGYRFNGGAAITNHVFEGTNSVTVTNQTASPKVAYDIAVALRTLLAEGTGGITIGASTNAFGQITYTPNNNYVGAREDLGTTNALVWLPTKYTAKWTPAAASTFAMDTATTYPRATYSLWVYSTNTITFDAQIDLQNSITPSGTNLWVIGPADTTTNWVAVGRAF